MKKSNSSLTYARLGIDRKSREKSQTTIQSLLAQEADKYEQGKPVRLPFGYLYPFSRNQEYYYDLQIEGVGTKTLLAELSGRYNTIGIDGVAMVANDVLRSGALPLLVSDGIHEGKSDSKVLRSILEGVRAGAAMADCPLASGETGEVQEILHLPISKGSLPFDLFVSCLGVAEREEVILGEISLDDCIIGLDSSGIHSNGLTLARKILLRHWGGVYDNDAVPDGLDHSILQELMEPTRIYVKALKKLKHERIRVKAAIHITGDGLAKFWRLLKWQKSGSTLGVRLELSKTPQIFRLIMSAARTKGTPITTKEMLRTFNMGVGFALVVAPEECPFVLDCLNNEFAANKIGTVSDGGRISVKSPLSEKALFI